MAEPDLLAEQFEASRPHLRAVAYRMLGSLSLAEDAVQEGWLRLSRSDASDIDNLGGWLTTVVARVCLDMLRARQSRREESLDTNVAEPVASRAHGGDPEHEALLADSVGLALLVVLEMLEPAERLAFVLHDMFAMPFETIAPIVGRSSAAARQLASRARRRVHAKPVIPEGDLARQRKVVEAYLAAARRGDFDALVAILDPDVVARSDRLPLGPGGEKEVRGAAVLAERAIKAGARAGRAALVNGAVGIIVAPRGRLLLVLQLTIEHGRITAVEAIADPDHVRQLDLALLPPEDGSSRASPASR